MVIEDEVRATVDRFWAGWEALDAAAVLGTIAPRPDTVIIGTDESEYWVGPETMVGPFEAMMSVFEEEHVRWEPGDPLIDIRDGIAWVVGRARVSVRAGGEGTDSTMRTTFVLERFDAGWRIVHAHFSVPPPAPVVGY